MDKKTVNILGTEYEIDFQLDRKEADGEAGFYRKKISIRPLDKMLDEDSTEKEKEARQKEVIRHELWHCIMYEGGMGDYACDEKLIDALATLSPKAFKLFVELGAIDIFDGLRVDANWIATGKIPLSQ